MRIMDMCFEHCRKFLSMNARMSKFVRAAREVIQYMRFNYAIQTLSALGVQEFTLWIKTNEPRSRTILELLENFYSHIMLFGGINNKKYSTFRVFIFHSIFFRLFCTYVYFRACVCMGEDDKQ